MSGGIRDRHRAALRDAEEVELVALQEQRQDDFHLLIGEVHPGTAVRPSAETEDGMRLMFEELARTRTSPAPGMPGIVASHPGTESFRAPAEAGEH